MNINPVFFVLFNICLSVSVMFRFVFREGGKLGGFLQLRPSVFSVMALGFPVMPRAASLGAGLFYGKVLPAVSVEVGWNEGAGGTGLLVSWGARCSSRGERRQTPTLRQRRGLTWRAGSTLCGGGRSLHF